jgi:transposase
VDQLSRIGMDTSEHIIQYRGMNAAEAPVLGKKLRGKEAAVFFERHSPTVIAIEACGVSHHWARLPRSFGYSVKLTARQLVRPYVKRGKNDAANAEALCEPISRPTMRFVPVRTAEQQAAWMLVGARDRLIRNRTRLSNIIRGHAAEFGLAGASARHGEQFNGPLFGRSVVWNSCRGNHPGQRSCASTPKRRTYGRTRSDQSTAKHLARKRLSTYGSRAIR